MHDVGWKGFTEGAIITAIILIFRVRIVLAIAMLILPKSVWRKVFEKAFRDFKSTSRAGGN